MTINDYLQREEARFLQELFELLSIPSVSTDPDHGPDVARCAHWLRDHLEKIGLHGAEVCPTEGHPIVYAEHLEAGDDKPTLLLYGHYDVQPPDPLDEWDTPPFEPTVRDGKILARGATDDKGQFFAHIKGLEAWLSTTGSLPVNVKVLIEGEEEVGSPSLAPWIEENVDRLRCDAVIISDSSMFAPGIPAITYGLRGLAYIELTLQGPDHDLHSGLYGGGVPNPVLELSRILSALHDEEGRVQIPGFYDKVRPLDPEEREAFAALPFDDEEFRAETGAPGLKGEAGYTTLERLWARPTLDVNGIWGGFTGKGAKTVLPSRVHAKLSCRLVPDQEPEEIAALLKAHIENLADDSVAVDVRFHHGGRPVITDRNGPIVKAATRAFDRVWKEDTVFIRGGGSIPVVADFATILGAPTVLMGFGLENDRLHSPNEKLNLENFYAGIQTSAYLWEESAKK